MRKIAMAVVATISLVGTSLVATPAQAATPKPTTGAFPLVKPNPKTEKGVKDRRAQAFAYDNSTQKIYVTQPTTDGDFRVVKVDNAKPSSALEYATMKGFGHGSSIGLETNLSDGTKPFIWLETGPTITSDGAKYGTRIVRIQYTSGNTYSYNTKTGVVQETLGTSKTPVASYSPIAAPTPKCIDSKGKLASTVKSASVTVDPATKHVVIRYRVGKKSAYRTYNAADLVAGNFTPLASIEGANCMTAPRDLGNGLSFQGFASVNNQIFQMLGKKGKNTLKFVRFGIDGSNPSVKTDPTGAKAYAKGAKLAGWEAEGLAVRLLETGPMLRWGMTGTSGGRTKIAIYQLNPNQLTP